MFSDDSTRFEQIPPRTTDTSTWLPTNTTETDPTKNSQLSLPRRLAGRLRCGHGPSSVRKYQHSFPDFSASTVGARHRAQHQPGSRVGEARNGPALGAPHQNGFRIGYAFLQEKDLRRGLERLAEAIEKEQRR